MSCAQIEVWSTVSSVYSRNYTVPCMPWFSSCSTDVLAELLSKQNSHQPAKFLGNAIWNFGDIMQKIQIWCKPRFRIHTTAGKGLQS